MDDPFWGWKLNGPAVGLNDSLQMIQRAEAGGNYLKDSTHSPPSLCPVLTDYTRQKPLSADQPTGWSCCWWVAASVVRSGRAAAAAAKRLRDIMGDTGRDRETTTGMGNIFAVFHFTIKRSSSFLPRLLLLLNVIAIDFAICTNPAMKRRMGSWGRISAVAV